MADDPLLDATRRALAKFGYVGATAERIASEAGLSRVTLHRRGLTKDVLVDQLADEAVERYRERMWPALTSSGSARERLTSALHSLCEVAEENMQLLLALQARSDAIFHDAAPDGPVATRSVFTEPLERLLIDGVADGTLRDGDPAEKATLLFNLVGWTYIHLRTGHRWEADQARKAVVDLALNGVVE